MPEEIILTPQELEEIKDDVRYRTKTTESLKRLCLDMADLKELPSKVRVLQGKVGTHRWLIGFVFTLILTIFAVGLRWLMMR